MRVEPVSGRVLAGPLTDVYVYEAPVRLWHWVTVLCFTVLGVTGYLISAPLPALGGGSGCQRLLRQRLDPDGALHRRRLLAVAFLVRLYWAIVGNHHARSIFHIPFWSGAWWKGLFRQAAYYLFVRPESDHWVGHNPLAQLAMFFMFMLGSSS